MAKMGRPRTWPETQESLKEMNKRIEAFFKKCKDDDEIPTVEELALVLDFTSRFRLSEYENNKYFSNIIKKAKTRMFSHQKQLALQGKINPTIFIFNSKNNYGMKDKVEQEITTPVNKPMFTIQFSDGE